MSIKSKIIDQFYKWGNIPAWRVEMVALKRAHRSAAQFLKQNPQPPLTQADKEEIDHYWRRYGIRFTDYTWFEMLYGITGLHDPRFIPDPLAQRVVFRYYNELSAIQGWDDKNLYEKLLPGIAFAETLAHIYRGKVYDKDWKYSSQENLQALSSRILNALGDDKTIVVKQARDTSTGRGVKLVDVDSVADVMRCINQHCTGNFIMQKRIHQSSFLAQFCSSSVNIFRVITWRHQGRIDVLSSSVRFGIEGSPTDVAYVNGVEIVNAAGLETDGKVNGRYVSMQGHYNGKIELTQPIVPNYEAILDMARQGHERLYPFDIVAWDITQDLDNNPLCIEFNVKRPGTTLYQFANGPLAGDLTEELLSFLVDDAASRKLIPNKYRI